MCIKKNKKEMNNSNNEKKTKKNNIANTSFYTAISSIILNYIHYKKKIVLRVKT